MKLNSIRAIAVSLTATSGAGVFGGDRVKTANGVLEGITERSGILAFRGIPFAEPPVGDLRWKAPRPVKDWDGVRRADRFGPRAMQRALFGDMNFRSDGMSEVCLHLNVWTPAKTGEDRLPVRPGISEADEGELRQGPPEAVRRPRRAGLERLPGGHRSGW